MERRGHLNYLILPLFAHSSTRKRDGVEGGNTFLEISFGGRERREAFSFWEFGNFIFLLCCCMLLKEAGEEKNQEEEEGKPGVQHKRL